MDGGCTGGGGWLLVRFIQMCVVRDGVCVTSRHAVQPQPDLTYQP